MSLSTARLDGSGPPPWDCARRSAGRNGGCEAAAAIEDESHEAEADELFQRALQLSPVGELAEKIKNQQRRLADRVMRANAQGLRLFRGCAAAYAGAGTASTFRPNPPLDVEAAIGELAVGEALVSFLDHKRRAHPGGAGPGGASPLHDHYREAQDRESAYELLRQRAAEAAAAVEAARR